MLCPPGRGKRRDHPLIAVLLVLVMVILEVSPVFHALMASVTWQAPPGGGLLGGGLVVPVWNWVKKFHTVPEVQVCQPSQVHPSMGPGSWPAPSKAAQTTG